MVALAAKSSQNYFLSAVSSLSISEPGARAQACLWGNGQSQSTVSVPRLLIQVGKIMSECWEAEGVCSGVWAPACPEVVREAGGGSRLSGTSRAARRPIQWLLISL